MEGVEGLDLKRFDFSRNFGEDMRKKKSISVPSSGLRVPDRMKEEKESPGEPKVLTEGDVEEARREGEERGRLLGLEEGREKYYREGYGVGEAEGRTKGVKELRMLSHQMTEKIGVMVQEVVEERREELSRMGDESVHVALAVLRKVMPLYEKGHGHEELKFQLQSVLLQLLDEDEISVVVSRLYEGKGGDGILDLFSGSGLRDCVKLSFEEGMGVSDVRVVWKGGMLERNMEKILRSVEGLVSKGGGE